MFSRAYVKLASLYLLIIMAISLLFSVSIYFVSVRELERGAGRQGQLLQDVLGPGRPMDERRLLQNRQENLEEARRRVIGQLVLVNVAILIVAGGLSYYLAYRTLVPIEEAHASLERFTADASHELRTPITAMKSEIEVTLSEPKLNLKLAKDQLHSNLEELEKLNNLSEGLLQLARLDASTLPKDSIAVSHMIDQAAERVAVVARKKKITVALPTINPELYTEGDQHSLVEGLVTVLDNALKYSPARSTVTVGATTAKHAIRITVADTGPGIKASELPHIFDRFYQADASRNKVGNQGYGLGLAIAQNIFQMHGGSIQAQSSLGRGTQMTITLPRIKV